MWKMLQQNEPDDYVIATGISHSIQNFVEEAFNVIGIADWKSYVEYNNPKYLRPAEVDDLIGDYSKAKEILGWEPKTSFKELVKMMVEADIEIQKKSDH
jgi:GDPmannose 4,6-dehydratase